MTNLITFANNGNVQSILSSKDICTMIFDMDTQSAPGPDGLMEILSTVLGNYWYRCNMTIQDYFRMS